MRTSITVSLLPSNPKIPFVLGPDLEASVRLASELGFDGFELFPPTLDAIDSGVIARLCQQYSVRLSTVGTGGGWLSKGLLLTSTDTQKQTEALAFVKGIISRAGDLGAPAIVGSMQGKAEGRPTEEVLGILGQALAELGDYAKPWRQPLLYEPLNRYETDLVNTIGQAVRLIESSGADNVMVLADLFHMNIEEACLATTLREHGQSIGHVHFVDSNRLPAGLGHTDFETVSDTLIETQYDGYLAVEAFPLPDQNAAARAAMNEFVRLGLIPD